MERDPAAVAEAASKVDPLHPSASDLFEEGRPASERGPDEKPLPIEGDRVPELLAPDQRAVGERVAAHPALTVVPPSRDVPRPEVVPQELGRTDHGPVAVDGDRPTVGGTRSKATVQHLVLRAALRREPLAGDEQDEQREEADGGAHHDRRSARAPRIARRPARIHKGSNPGPTEAPNLHPAQRPTTSAAREPRSWRSR